MSAPPLTFSTPASTTLTSCRYALASVLMLLGLLLSGCTASTGPNIAVPGPSAGAVVLRSDHRPPVVFDGGEGPSSIAASAALFASSPVAVVAAPAASDTLETSNGPAATAAVGLGVPLLMATPDDGTDLRNELDRLGAKTVVVYGSPKAPWEEVVGKRDLIAGATDQESFKQLLKLAVHPTPTRLETLVQNVAELQRGDDLALLEPSGTGAKPSAQASSQQAQPSPSVRSVDLPQFAVATQPANAVVLYTEDPASAAAVATARAAEASVQLVPAGDPRADSKSIAFLRQHQKDTIYAVGNAFGGTARFVQHTVVAINAPELPGGGQTVFPGRRMVALYGYPGTASLGVLGEQDISATVKRARDTAAQYERFSEEPVVPAFEIIATVASSEAGPDGNYSSESTIELLKPWIDAAEAAGVYVVLDLQPGRTDFLTQAKLYEELLKRPYVGLALDPEWRLDPGQHHMVQIGSVDATEINKVSSWLADLTRENNLPQKVLTLHEFSLQMITHRDQVDVSRDELAFVLHADGNGVPQQKIATWNALRNGLQPGIWMGWKNFYDEDSPTFTPEQTFTQVQPKPWFVSYQ